MLLTVETGYLWVFNHRTSMWVRFCDGVRSRIVVQDSQLLQSLSENLANHTNATPLGVHRLAT